MWTPPPSPPMSCDSIQTFYMGEGGGGRQMNLRGLSKSSRGQIFTVPPNSNFSANLEPNLTTLLIGKCMFNEWEEKILDQLKNNHRRKLTRAKPCSGPGMRSPSEVRRNRVNDDAHLPSYVYTFPLPAVWTCRVYSFRVPFHHQQ